MALPTFIQKTLIMKPEVTKIFDDLEEWLDQCRFNLMEYNPAHLYKSVDYKQFSREKMFDRRPKKQFKVK
jgi:hypothetical protein